MITCDKITETKKSITTKTVPVKSIPKSLNKKGDLWNEKFIYFTCLFINYHNIINNC